MPLAPRDPSIDALRGFLLATVIVGHFPTSAHGINPFGPFAQWVYFFHIPLFIALSCFFTKPFTIRQQGRRAAQILAPYAIWVALSHPQRLLADPAGLLRDAAMGNWVHLQSILWFLPALFTTNLLISLQLRAGLQGPRVRVAVNLLLALAAACAFFFAPQIAVRHARIPFGLDVALFLLPFTWALEQVWRVRLHLARAGAWLTFSALAALVLGGAIVQAFEPLKTHSPFARRVDFAQFSVPESLPGYLGMVLMSAALLALAPRIPFQRLGAAVGRYSMPVYLLHYPILFALTRTIGAAGESRGWLLLYAFGVTALVIALSILAARVLTRISPRFARMGLQAPAGP